MFRLKGIDLAELLQQPHDGKAYKSGYRSGFRAGWIACVDALAKALTIQAYTAAWDFWEHELLAWKFQQDGAGYFPPEMTLKVSRMTTRRPIPLRLRFAVLKRDNYRCQLCGIAAIDGPQVRLHVDHKHPHSRGGETSEANLWTLCLECNEGKHADSL